MTTMDNRSTINNWLKSRPGTNTDNLSNDKTQGESYKIYLGIFAIILMIIIIFVGYSIYNSNSESEGLETLEEMKKDKKSIKPSKSRSRKKKIQQTLLTQPSKNVDYTTESFNSKN